MYLKCTPEIEQSATIQVSWNQEHACSEGSPFRVLLLCQFLKGDE